MRTPQLSFSPTRLFKTVQTPVDLPEATLFSSKVQSLMQHLPCPSMHSQYVILQS
jgi:hypothetical protein